MYKSHKRIGVYGAGVSSRAVVDYFRRESDFHLTLRADTPGRNPVGADRVLFGALALTDIDEEMLFLSPTVRRERKELADAKERGVIISSDAELFFEKNSAPVYAVTGSSGKSTVTYLISELMRRVLKASPPIGNFGGGLCQSIGKYDRYAVELSSFQLNYFAPKSHRAVITNISPNHLDWHTDFEEYIRAKLNIAKHSEGLIIDSDCDLLRERAARENLPVLVSVGFSGEIKADAQRYISVSEDAIYLDGEPFVSLIGARRKERYNLKNYALAAAATLGEVSPGILEDVFGNFAGLRHRCELIAVSGGARYINSSIDTSPERTVATLRSLGGRTVPILMGKNKNLPLDELANLLPKITVGAVLSGEIGEALYEKITDTDYKKAFARNMDDAVSMATDMLGGEGQIVLTPAGTSFDLYKNYEARADDFCRAVKHFLSK